MHKIISEIKRNIKHLRKETPSDTRLDSWVNAKTDATYAEKVSDAVITSRVDSGYKTREENLVLNSDIDVQISDLAKEFEFTNNIPTKEAGAKATKTVENNEKLKFLEKKTSWQCIF
jgi:hypothetical protein